ncbi:MAG TPA: DUF6474 family protein [Pseudonocardiaceae bacterium]|jgi:hypothetical protein|nr:DUF6474 family protein [Pseudonocardiaceae bacterium]
MALRKKGIAAREPRFTPGKAKNLVGVAKIVLPAVVPVVSPYLLKAAGTARDQLDRMRARRMGIEVGDLAKFSGKGGALHARIVGASDSLAELAEKNDPATREFTERGIDTLRTLAVAVRAAERMPGARRRAAHQAVAAELDRIESELLRRLGV